MVTAAWDTSGLVALYKDGLQCVTCCTEFSVVDCCCFLEPETESACDNVDWDAFPPYGGPGKTPQLYTLSYIISWRESGLSVTYHSNALGRTGGYENCQWFDNTTQDSNGETIGVRIFLRHSDVPVPSDKTQIIIGYNDFIPCNPSYLATGEYKIRINTLTTLGECEIAGAFGCNESFPSSLDNCCLIRMKNDITQDWEYGDIEIAWYPGQIPEWDECTDYEVGDKVAWEGVFYICTQAHNAGTPPGCTGSKEPPNASYWDVI